MDKIFVSFLHGINVGSQKKILMTDLKVLYESLGFSNVETFIQSGNVIFKTDKKLTDFKLAKLIQDKIVEQYNFDVPVIIRTIQELQNIILSNPYQKDKNMDIENLYVTFLAKNPNATNLENLDNINYLPDTFEILDKEIYIDSSSYGTSKLSNSFFENKLKVIATTRSWKSIKNIIEISIIV